jgi:hypothetical protein
VKSVYVGGENINEPLVMSTYWIGMFFISISILRDWSENSEDKRKYFVLN